MTGKKPEGVRKIPDNDPGLRWLQPPGIFCDTFTLDTWIQSGIVRISFGESMDRDTTPIFRTSVALPLVVAKDLAQFLTDSVKEAEEREQKRKAEKEEPVKKPVEK